jgi:hypothetical protein
MMPPINNWDLKESNNAIYEEGPERIYFVSDLGASFGTTGYNPRHEVSKVNLRSYRHSHFITRTTTDYVDFRHGRRCSCSLIRRSSSRE